MLFLYKCPRCSNTTFLKKKYINHLKQKELCKPILSNDNLENEYIKYDIKEKYYDIKKNNHLIFSELKEKLYYNIV